MIFSMEIEIFLTEAEILKLLNKIQSVWRFIISLLSKLVKRKGVKTEQNRFLGFEQMRP